MLRLYANSWSKASQEISRGPDHPKVYYRSQKNLPLEPVLNQRNPIHTLSNIFPFA